MNQIINQKIIKKINIGVENHIMLILPTNESNIGHKLFCGCVIEQETCGICLGYPGALPNFNINSINAILKLGIMLNSKIEDVIFFDRKKYAYWDLPKLYQITQNLYPTLTGGKINNVLIHSAHLEEDAGKVVNNEVSFLRSGCPLIELVTKPCMHSIEELEQYLKNLRNICLYLKLISPLKSNAIRCDVNFSFEYEDGTYSKRVELKNLNSISDIKQALNYELKSNLIYDMQQTKGWNGKETYFMREKKIYVYMPEYDLPGLDIRKIKNSQNYLNYLINFPDDIKFNFNFSKSDLTLIIYQQPNIWLQNIASSYNISINDNILQNISIDVEARTILYVLTQQYDCKQNINGKNFLIILMNIYNLILNAKFHHKLNLMLCISNHIYNQKINFKEIETLCQNNKYDKPEFLILIKKYINQPILVFDNINKKVMKQFLNVKQQNIPYNDKIFNIKKIITNQYKKYRIIWQNLMPNIISLLK